jgi:hypothetical protein
MGRVLNLPSGLLDLDDKDRNEILNVLFEAEKLPKTKRLPVKSSESKLWEKNPDPLLSWAEDQLFTDLAEEELNRFTHVMALLGLPLAETDSPFTSEKSFEGFDLLKATDSGRNNMSALIQAGRKKRESFMKWVNDGKAMTQAQVKKLDEFLRKDIPDYAKKAEEFMVRAGFIGKIHNQAERENFEVLSGYLDRVPQSIEPARKEGVVLTLREKQKEERKGRKVEVLPLTAQETEAVRHASLHAGDKLTEISEKHIAGVRQLVIQAKKERWTAQKLAQELFDRFGDHNRDWRRVAMTELAMATNDAYLSGLEEGERVTGIGSVNACKHCRSLVIGREFIVLKVPPSEESYDNDMKYVWAGKTNMGRPSTAWRACFPIHPNCSCRPHRISRFYNVDKDGTFKRKTTAELIAEERAKRGLAPDPNIEAQLEKIRKMIDQ